MRNIQFVVREEEKCFELWIDGKCITDCFCLDSESGDLMEQLVTYANIPVFKMMPKEKVIKIVKNA